MKPVRTLVGLTVAASAALLLGSNAAYAAGGQVDGSITVAGSTCTWTNASTSDVPPNTLTIDHTTVSASCGGSISASLGNDPSVTFDDSTGTATSPEIDVSATVAGISCGYQVTDLTVSRQSGTRTYTGGPYTAAKTSGSFLCPGSETVDSVSLTFH
ncbi:hypothetical protein Athai_32650 [Actinocatenispora thailandica]|uniref:Uncharacterized protein n=1 Tax=Actinocatenispora thailandica TaxID=227318 RepID=A0A7R7DQP9_9ACTN|nr:hypothetical protein [Actinocatenispora thailandica]BCJ35762.1 hypothetical protein Athai_32650 [Actinocatenispora thailandica]